MAIFGRRQPHGPIILRPKMGLAAGPPIGQIVQLNQSHQTAPLYAHRLPWGPVIKTVGPPAATGHLVSLTRQSQLAALFAHRPLFRPIINRLGPPAPIARLVVPRNQGQALAAALAERKPYRYKSFIGILYTYVPMQIAPVASTSIIKGANKAQVAAIAARQPRIFRPTIKTVGSQPSINRIVPIRGQIEAQAAALRARQPRIFKPFIGILDTFVPFIPPPQAGYIQKIIFPIGRLAAQATANAYRHPLLKKPGLPIGGKPVPLPGHPGGRIISGKPYFPRVVTTDTVDKLREFADKVSTALNSLVAQGQLIQKGPEKWMVSPGGGTGSTGSGLTGTFP